ncbi:UNVERIFIED_CONTAM: hypothetical protein FKN15_029253 [Acipenser sinensis]
MSPAQDTHEVHGATSPASSAMPSEDLNSKMTQVLEYLARQQAVLNPALPQAPALGPTPLLPVVAPDISEQAMVMSEEEQDVISITSWDGGSFPHEVEEGEIQELTQETGPSSEATSETERALPSSLIQVLVERACKFLCVSWIAAPEPRCSVFRKAQALCPQPFPAFLDFMEEAPALGPTPLLPVVAPDISEQAMVMSEEEQDVISITSWDGGSFPHEVEEGEIQELTQETGPSSEATSETERALPSSLIQVLEEQACKFLCVSWTAAPEPRCSVFRKAQALCPQPFPAFLDFMEEVRSFWYQPASAPSVLK